MGVPEAVTAATEAGYRPEDNGKLLVFLFVTEQWADYDLADPHGRLLRRYCAKHDNHDPRIIEIARRAGRPNPVPSRPKPPARSTAGRSWRTGSLPTDPGATDHGGGDFGSVGGFSTH